LTEGGQGVGGSALCAVVETDSPPPQREEAAFEDAKEVEDGLGRKCGEVSRYLYTQMKRDMHPIRLFDIFINVMSMA